MSPEVNPFESLQEQIDDASDYLDINDVVERLKRPDEEEESTLVA